MAHAFLSPSDAPGWVRCNVKPWREKDIPDFSSEAADEGTAAHYLRDRCLTLGCDALEFKGLTVQVDGYDTKFVAESSGDKCFAVDADMVREVQKSIDVVRTLSNGGTLYPEQQLSIEHITGEAGSTGTSDAVIVHPTELCIDDLKYGRGIQVFAENNEQLLIYGGAALEEFDVLGEIETLRMRISQPRMNHEDEWVLPVAEVRERLIAIRQIADKIMAGPEGLTATPGDKQCKFCKVKATCAEHRDFILGAVTKGFVDLDKGFVEVSLTQAEKLLAQAFGVKPAAVEFDSTAESARFTVKKPSIRPALEVAEAKLVDAEDERLATLMDAADMLEGFAKAVRAEVERRLLKGTFSDARYKLVEGKRGSRAWIVESEVEAMLKSMRLKVDQMYDFKLISPTSAEKLLASAYPRKWTKLQASIHQTNGKPSVAPASDKRPALSMAIAEGFEVIQDGEDLV